MLIPVLFGVSLIVFFLMRVCAPDPAPIVLGQHATQESMNAWREANGLNDPIVVQYIDFIKGALTGDLGTSYFTKAPVTEEIMARFPATVELALVAIVLASLLGVSVGVISAVKKNSIFDNGGMLLSLVGVSVPIFWLGIMLIILFSGTMHWLPSSGRIDPALRPDTITGFMLIDCLLQGDTEAFTDALRHMILPAITLSLFKQDYIRTAKAKGISDSKVDTKHALRNAMMPIVTVIGLQLGSLLGGAVLTESVYSWPGLGNYTVQCIMKSDFPVIQGVVLLIAVIFVLMNLLVDVLYAFLDPRIKYAKKEV